MIYYDNIENQTENNTDYRRVIFTGPEMQIVLMALKPGEEIGLEAHTNGDQFFRVEQGTGEIDYGESMHKLFTNKISSGFGISIPKGIYHNIRNTSTTKFLKLYTIYTPPQHKPYTIQHTKPINDDDHNNHNHDDNTNNYYNKYIYYKELYKQIKNRKL